MLKIILHFILVLTNVNIKYHKEYKGINAMTLSFKQPYYNNTIKRLVAIFGSVFDELQTEDNSGNNIKVPLIYAPREKFLTYTLEKASIHEPDIETVLPRMSFELVDFAFDSTRRTNQHNKLKSKDGSSWQYNRVPYNFNFKLYIATKQFNDGLKIVEQFAPLFDPSINVTVNELDEFQTETDLAIVMNDINFDIDYEGDFTSQRLIFWEVTFTLKGYLYRDNKKIDSIKKVIVNLRDYDFDTLFSKFTASVVPFDAKKEDPHTIEEKVKNYD